MQLMRYRRLYFLISGVFILPSLWSLFQFGLKPAIDFTGGSLIEISITPSEGKEVSETTVREALGEREISSFQRTGEGTILLRAKPLTESEKNTLLANLRENLGDVQEKRFESVGPTIGKELLRQTATALSIAAFLILLYVAYRFQELRYGVCAILAMLHDSIILLGSFSLLGKFAGVEVDTLFVTAVLTTLSFSVHDTIVVYDRIRESRKRHPKTPYLDLVNLAVAETLGRSLNNSLTIVFMLVALLLFGGVTTRWFVFALLLGTISGTYSSTFTAAPLLVVWEKIRAKKA